MAAIIFSLHAEAALQLRDISRASVEAIIVSPSWIEPDPRQLGVLRAFGRTPETGHRWIRVAYRLKSNSDMFVITVLPDRGARPPETANDD